MVELTQNPQESLSLHIAHYIADNIIKGTLIEGERIQEIKICNALNVSRGSVREALLILERSFLIDILPRRGAVVSEFSVSNVRSLYDVFLMYGTHIVQKAAQLYREPEWQAIDESLKAMNKAAEQRQADELFPHLFAILDLCVPMLNNPYLTRHYQHIVPALRRSYSLLVSSEYLELPLLAQLFTQVMRSVRVRDADSASKLMHRFVSELSTVVIQSLMRMKQIELALSKRKGRG